MAIRELRERIASYLADEISLDELDHSIAARTWNIHQSGNEEAARLAYAIELRLAEYSAGHLPLDQLRSELLRLVDSYTVTLGTPVWRPAIKSSDVTIPRIQLAAV